MRRLLGFLFRIAVLWTQIRIMRLGNLRRRVYLWWLRVTTDRCTKCGGFGYSGVDESGKVRACPRCKGSGKFRERWL